MSGTVRLGRYALHRPVGRGGFATVWAARHTLLGTTHAVKLLDAITPQRVARLEREGRLQSTLDPQCVVPVIDVVAEHSRVGLVMPLVEGCSLAELLRAHRPSPPEVHALLSAVLHGVAAAHGAGVVHCDLKPANVLLDVHLGRVRARVADFGIAYTHEPGAGRDGFEGTPAFAAPEQLDPAGEIDARTDLFALGCVLVELLGGARRSARDVPTPWAPLAQALLAEDPSHRPACAADVWPLLPQDLADPRVLRVGRPLATAVRALQNTVAASVPDLDPTLVTWSDATIGDPSDGAPPPDPGPLIGRDATIADVIRTLRGAVEPVWLVGPAGIGKTALALALAREQRVERSGGVWVVSLDRATSTDEATRAVARRIGLLDDGAIGPLVEAIRARGRCLLILDGVAPGAAPTALLRDLQQHAPEARVIVTARAHPVGVTVVRVAPLTLDEGVALLRARRAGVVPASQAVKVVRALDGVPLAIELVAAREDLSGPDLDLSAALADAFEGSWRPLPPSSKRLLAAVSALEGPFDEAAARALWAPGTPVLEHLDALVRRSLVRPEGHGWFRLLGGARAVARNEAAALGVDLEAVRDELARHLAGFGTAEALDDLAGPGGTERQRHLGRHVDDLIVCTRRAAERFDAEIAVGLALATARVLVRDGPVGELPGLLEGVEVRSDLDATARVQLALAHADASGIVGDDDALVQSLRRAEALLDRVGSPSLRARVVLERGHRALRRLEHDRVRASVVRARRESDDLRTQAVSALQLGSSAAYRGEKVEAIRHLREAVALGEALGDAALLGRARGNLANVLSEAGADDEALTHYEAALVILYACRDHRTAAITRSNLGLLLRQRGELDAAARTLDEALREHLRVGNRRSAAISLMHRGTTLRLAGDVEAAEASFREAEARLLAIGNDLLAADARGQRGLLIREHGRLDEAHDLLSSALAAHQGGVHPEAESTWLRELAWIAAARAQPWRPLVDRSLTATSGPTGRAATHTVHAELALREGHLDEARAAIERALEQDPRGILRAEALGALAGILRAEGDHESCRDALAEAVDLVDRAGIGERCAIRTGLR